MESAVSSKLLLNKRINLEYQMKKELVKREIEKTCAYYSTNEWVSINGDLKNKILKLNIIQEEKGNLQQTYLLHKRKLKKR